MKDNKGQTPEKDKAQRRLFKKTRGGVVLTANEVKEIKAGRKKLRKELRKNGIRKRKDFEVTASSMGLYFDKRRKGVLWLWLGWPALWAMIGAFILLLSILFAASVITQLRGHFTINLSEDMFKSGFTLSETIGFEEPKISLNSDPLENVPCTSISNIPEDVNRYEGNHHGYDYFAYTFYVRNEGDAEADYSYQLRIVSESQEVSEAIWLMLFVDGDMTYYAQMGADNAAEAIPEIGDNSRGYTNLPLMDQTLNRDTQYQFITQKRGQDYYRVIPVPFESETVITYGERYGLEPMGIHKYTVVIWAEGDDPECTDDIIGGHLGLDMDLRLLEEYHDEEAERTVWAELQEAAKSIFDNLKFWE